jgi:TP901 family phage tail tape measure protein
MPGMYKYSMEIESNVKKLLLDTKELQDKMDTLEGKEYKINLNIDEKKLGNVISNLEKMLDSLGKGTGDFKQFENLSKELSSIVSEVQSLSKAFGKVDDSGTKTLLSSIQNIDKSLSELSQNILNVNKNMSNMGGDTSGAVKQVENISDAYQNAAKEAVKLADAQSKIGQKTNISLGDSKEQSTEIDLYHNLEKRKVTYDEIIDKIQTIISLKEKEKSLSKTSDDTKLYQKLYDENDINWAGDTEGTINRISDRLKEIYIKYNGKISLINENDIQEAAYLLDILKGAGESPNLNKSQEKFYQNKKFSNDSLFDNIHVDSQKTGEIDKINTELSETYRWFNQLEGVSLNENIANEIKSLISDMQIGGKNANEYANDLLKIFNIEVGSNSVVEQQNKLQSELKETESQAEKTTMAVKEVSSTASTEQKKDAFPDKDISASVESATNSIKEENNVLEQNTQKVKENTQAKEQNANVNFNKYDKRLDSYNGKIDKYKTTIDRFNDGGWTSNTYLENVQAVKDAVNEYETLLNELKGKDASLVTSDDISKLDEYEKKIKDTIATVTNMSAAEKGYNFVSGQKELDKIHKLLNENSKMSSEAKAKIRAYYTEIESGNPSMSLDRIHGEIMKIYNAEVEAGRAGRSFFDTLKNSGFHQLAAQMSGMFGFYDVINLIKQAASAVTELNTQITELAKVSEDSVSQIYADFDSYANIAKEMGSTISDTIAATTAWSKDGYNIPDSKELAEVSLLYKNVGDGINIDEANESLVSTLKGFKLEADQAEHIVDVFNEVSNREPISSSGIGEALQRSAASFNAANTSLEKSVALVTATNSVLQDPEKVGNMWKTVSARIRGAKTELEEAGEDTDGMVESTSKLQALIKGMTGFDIMESDGKTFKDIYDIIIGIGKKWQDLNDVDRASLLEKLAGKNQSNALAAALSQVDLLKKAYGEATNAEGSAREENSKYQQSVQYSIDQTKAKLEELANDTLNSKFLKGLINAGGKIIDILDIIIKNVGILKPLIAGLAIKNIVKNFD